MAGNGALRPAAALADRFDFQQWHALTEKAAAECERRLEEARAAARAAAAAAEAHARELAVLRRALTLTPDASATPEAPDPTDAPPRAPESRLLTSGVAALTGGAATPPAILRGVRTGKGAGSQSAVYLLELARVRVGVKADRRLPGRRPGRDGMAGVDLALDGGEALTPDVVALSCKGWARSTVRDGLRRLVDDGMLERTSPGCYRLTPAGLAAGPSAAGMLPLIEPDPEREEPAPCPD